MCNPFQPQAASNRMDRRKKSRVSVCVPGLRVFSGKKPSSKMHCHQSSCLHTTPRHSAPLPPRHNIAIGQQYCLIYGPHHKVACGGALPCPQSLLAWHALHCSPIIFSCLADSLPTSSTGVTLFYFGFCNAHVRHKICTCLNRIRRISGVCNIA